MADDPEGARELGRIVDGDGKPLVKMFCAPNALSDDANALAQGLYLLSETIIRGLLPEERHGGLGGDFGYGAEYENDTFRMHPYCWCEEESCLWCSGACGCPDPKAEYFLDEKPVNDWSKANDALLGPWRKKMPRTKSQQADFDAAIAERDRRLVTIFPARTHTCEPKGLMSDRPRGTDWRPSQLAPHFWHKPSGFKVWWYKWIGRDMHHREIPHEEWLHIWTACMESIPTDAHAETDRQRAHEDTPEYRAEEERQMQAMHEVIREMFDKHPPTDFFTSFKKED